MRTIWLYHAGAPRRPFVVAAGGARYNRGDAPIPLGGPDVRTIHAIASDCGARAMKVILRNPRREVEIGGRRRVKELLGELDILPSTVLVIRGDELLTSDTVVGDDDVVEVRPVMSGGQAGGDR